MDKHSTAPREASAYGGAADSSLISVKPSTTNVRLRERDPSKPEVIHQRPVLWAE